MTLWLNTTFNSIDYSLLSFFHEFAIKCGNILTPIAKFLDVTCDLPLLMIGWLGFVLFFVKKDKKCGMLMCAAIVIGALLTTIILKNIIYRPRPYINSDLYNSWWKMFELKENWDTSFPSGHACASMSGVSAYFIWSKNKKVSWICFLYPIIVASSRIYLCVHYPSDVFAGIIVGFISALLALLVVNLIYKLLKKYPDFILSKYCFTGKIK